MSSLHELQQNFLKSILNNTPELAEEIVETNNISGTERLAIYRNNVFGNFTSALASVYTVIQSLVGENFFNYAASQYIRQYPSHSGDIHHFGKNFANLLNTLPEAKSLVYLTDVARLEWLIHESFHAANHAPLALDRLADILPEDYPKLIFILHPACRLMHSPYPIQHIWKMNQPGYQEKEIIRLDEGESWLLLVRREDFTIDLVNLSQGQFLLLEALSEKVNFNMAVDKALQIEPDIDLPSFLQQQVLQHTIVGFELS